MNKKLNQYFLAVGQSKSGPIAPSLAELERGIDISGAFKARRDTRYIDELQQRWDDEFERQGAPLARLVGVARPGTGLVALVTKRTVVALGSRE